MPRPKTTATERITLAMQVRVLDLLGQEASLLGVERPQLVRMLITRAMGQVQMARTSTAPPRQMLSAPSKAPAVQQIDFHVNPEHKQWLQTMSLRSGGLPMSGIVTLLILDWAGINPLMPGFGASL